METIKELKDRAIFLSEQNLYESVTPKMVGGLFEGSLDYIQKMEHNLKNIGIRKTYATKELMLLDETPVDFKNNPIRFGQLVSIYSESEEVHNNEVYAYCAPGWNLVGKIVDMNRAKVEEETLIFY